MEWIEVPEKGLTLREVRTMTNRNVNLSDDWKISVRHPCSGEGGGR